MVTPIPPARDGLPAIPGGAHVTAWQATLPETVKGLSPRAAMVLLLHVSWLRWQQYAALLKQQAENAPAREGMGKGAAGYVRHRVGMSAGQPYPITEELRALVKLEADERDRCARLAERAFTMGISLADNL